MITPEALSHGHFNASISTWMEEHQINLLSYVITDWNSKSNNIHVDCYTVILYANAWNNPQRSL